MGSGKAYLLYTCENVVNCEQPLTKIGCCFLFPFLQQAFSNIMCSRLPRSYHGWILGYLSAQMEKCYGYAS